ncbi:MAG TPA: heat-inducible transcriptional repressor HrcA [Bacilli bacterium]|nr:heat-inducible transcriptional repressor HrcA [Bacilli bacterium]
MEERQKYILKEIIETYIKKVKPVGSKLLAKRMKCSSATVRNEMAHLEDLGLIEKAHVSSGRIPSEKGYKYYVDNLMKPKELTGEDVLKLQTIFQNHELVLSDAINSCMQVISDITSYTSVVLGKSSKENALKQVSIVPLDNSRIIALICTDKGLVINKQFNLEKSINLEEVVKTSEIVNKMLIGTPIDEVNERLEFEVKPVIAKKMKQYEAVYNIFYDAFTDFTKNNLFMSGKTNFLKQPEYNNVEEVRKIINKFEDESFIKHIEAKKEGINIYIGKETEIDPNVTVIKTKFCLNGEEKTIAIVGPKRMEYGKVVALLDYINKNIGGV